MTRGNSLAGERGNSITPAGYTHHYPSIPRNRNFIPSIDVGHHSSEGIGCASSRKRGGEEVRVKNRRRNRTRQSNSFTRYRTRLLPPLSTTSARATNPIDR